MNQIDLINAKKQLENDGYFIIEDLINHYLLDTIHESMRADTNRLYQQKKWGGLGSLPGHLQQNPPRIKPYVFKEIISNPTIIKITKSVLGNNLFNDFYSANVNCPGSIHQPLHRDCFPLWPKDNVSHPAVTLIINIPLGDVNQENGGTEIWPGTHQLLNIGKFPTKEDTETRIKITPPLQLNMKKGSVLIRDARLWHRGMPNRSNEPRYLLAMLHHIYWFPRGEKLSFSVDCENEIINSDLEHHVYFTNERIDLEISEEQNNNYFV